MMRKRGRKAKCPTCGSNRTISKGTRKTVQLGDRPLRLCRDCGHKFTLGRKPTGNDVQATGPVNHIDS